MLELGLGLGPKGQEFLPGQLARGLSLPGGQLLHPAEPGDILFNVGVKGLLRVYPGCGAGANRNEQQVAQLLGQITLPRRRGLDLPQLL